MDPLIKSVSLSTEPVYHKSIKYTGQSYMDVLISSVSLSHKSSISLYPLCMVWCLRYEGLRLGSRVRGSQISGSQIGVSGMRVLDWGLRYEGLRLGSQV